MKKAQRRNAVLSEKFYFRPQNTSLATSSSHPTYSTSSATLSSTQKNPALIPTVNSYSINEIINGTKRQLGVDPNEKGLIPIIRDYLDSLKLEPTTRQRLDKYLDFVADRASGKIMTAASWLRDQVQQHPLYQRDSVISPEINFHLLKSIQRLTKDHHRPTNLFGTASSSPSIENKISHGWF